MKTLRKVSLLALCASMALAAHATQPAPTTPAAPPVNVSSTGIGVATSTSASTAYNSGGLGYSTSAIGPITLNNSFSAPASSAPTTPASVLDMGGASLGNTTTTTTISSPRQTPPSYAPQASAPMKSCRLLVGLGGAGSGASGSAGIPIGNDAYCVVENSLALMDKFPGVFSNDDRLKLACSVEGMAESKPCVDFREGARPRAILNNEGTARPVALLP